MHNLVGSIVIEVRDENTLELKDTITANNVITVGLFLNNMNRPDSVYRNWLGTSFNGTGYPMPHEISISGRVIHPNNKSLGYEASGLPYPVNAIYPTNHVLRAEDTQVFDWTYTDSIPPFLERKARFNSPAQVDTINSIYLVNENDSDVISSAIALITPCIQNPGEVLDITYRIQFYDQQSLNTGGTYISPDYYKISYIGSLLQTQLSEHAFPSQPYIQIQKTPAPSVHNEMLNVVAPYAGANPISRSFELPGIGTTQVDVKVWDHFKISFINEIEKDDFVGRVIRSIGIGGNENSQMFDVPTAANLVGKPLTFQSISIIAPFVSDTFAFKPIQPIQNHNKDAIEWGLDVDFLATSQGSLTVNGDNWTDDDWPEFWRVEFTKDGNVGVSNYYFRNRRTIGFDGNDYKPDPIYRAFDHSSQLYPDRKTADKGHGLHQIERNEEYGPDSYISWDSTGINLHVINNPIIIAYDATTTPALNVTDARQVAVDSAGNVWVACKSTGLHRITNPLDKDTATVTNMTEGANGLFAGSGNLCYAVATGFNGSIWAVFEGALSHTTNPNDPVPTFNNYNPASGTTFDYTGLTDGNWSSVLYMKVDRAVADNELAVIYNSGADIHQIVWWSLAGITYTGPASGTNMNDGAFVDGTQINAIDVSQRGSLWARIGPNRQDEIQVLSWSETTDTNYGAGLSSAFSRPIFFYDYYDTPYLGNTNTVLEPGTTTATDLGYGLVSVDNIRFSTSIDFNSQTYGTGIAWQDKRASGIFVTSLSSSYSSFPFRGSQPDVIYQLTPNDVNGYLDSLNGQHSPYEELCWDKFHWNGVSWEKDYYVDAVDTSTTTNYPGSRHNFDTENHSFTGRSMIDVTNSFAASNYSDTITFVGSIQPNEKDDSSENGGTYDDIRVKRQERPMTLFDFSSKTTQCKLLIKNGDTSPSMVFYANGVANTVATALPEITSGSYRYVVVITATTIDVYVDGAQVGSTITLSTPIDFTDSDLLAHIGCSTYNFNHTNRHTPWQSDFFKGTMENVQLWNVAWDSTDVTNDYANVTGVITSKPAATNLIARYELTENLEGTETKTTHVTPELLDEGVTIAFNDGTSGTSFIATDYYTFGVVDGMLKDNATSITRESSLYHKPVDHEFTEFKNSVGTSVIEGTTAAQVTETAIFRGSLTKDDSTFWLSQSSLSAMDYYPGKLYQNSSSQFSSTTFPYQYVEGGFTQQPIVNDGYVEATPAMQDCHMMVGLADDSSIQIGDSSDGQYQQRTRYNMMARPTGDISIVEDGVVVQANIATFTLDTIFRIRRTGTTVTYHIENSGSETLLYTSALAATGTFYGIVVFPYSGNGVINAKINYTKISNMLTIGDPNTNTGVYDPKFLRVDATDQSSYEILIDGSVAQVVSIRNETFQQMPSPIPGEVVMNTKTGWLIFNSADIGKTVTGRVTVIYDEL